MLNPGRLLLTKLLVELGMIQFCDTLNPFQTALCQQAVAVRVGVMYNCSLRHLCQLFSRHLVYNKLDITSKVLDLECNFLAL